ncbi:hypothetical protein F7725_026639 [Dissostichus mawsoni]|uniref:Uncharacterized protein n=1 Tax=Dissostichus mawsoni TaxID=36200 RepID=A0A7J5X7K7_DISMA|nr:hypothetical protein F7725_026639 [Dissostichus mawsoni]
MKIIPLLINAALKQSQKEPQRGKTKLKNRITIMTSELEEDKKVIEKLQIDHHASSSQHQREISELMMLNTASERVNKCASDLKEEQTKSSSLQMDYEAAVSQQKEAEELARVTQGNQHLAYENKRLQSELEAALNKQHIEEKKLQGDRGACSRLEEAIKKEEARFSRASKK